VAADESAPAMTGEGCEIISVTQMRAIDSGAESAGMPVRMLMENAGRAVAGLIAARLPKRPVLVACGPGNNGGDGFVAARALAEAGWAVSVGALVPRESMQGAAADAACAWDGAVAPLAQCDAAGAIIVDALFGAGLARPLEGDALAFVRRIGAAPEAVVAVDVPSGLDADSGAPIGEACVRAGHTVTFERKKPAHLLFPGADYCGEVTVAPIGAPAAVIAAQNVSLWENAPRLWRALMAWPARDAHKHARGHAMVASGPAGRSGAARLAAHAALRAGAGLVTVCSPPDALAEHAAQLNAIMLSCAREPRDLAQAARAARALVIGPAFGLDDDARGRLDAVLGAEQRCALVLDADALTLLGDGVSAAGLSARDLATPHVGEFGRLFPGLLEASQSRVAAAREGARRAGCVVLLKGPDTVIAAPDGRAIINTVGSPFLATAGSGDVLAGIAAGLMAQGMDTFAAGACAAWIHGAAGEALGPGLIAEDIAEFLPHLFNALAPPKLQARWKSAGELFYRPDMS